MPIIHIFTLAGAVDEAAPEQISNDLIGEVIHAERAPDNEIVRSISSLLWHDVPGWWTGQGRVGEDRPSYLVRVEVPSGPLGQADGQREELVEQVTGVLAKGQDGPTVCSTIPPRCLSSMNCVTVTGPEYLATDTALVVVASTGASPRHPDWFLNLKADPRCVVEADRSRRDVIAREAPADERSRLWPRLVQIYVGWDEYQRRTDRRIPVVLLEAVPGPLPSLG